MKRSGRGTDKEKLTWLLRPRIGGDYLGDYVRGLFGHYPNPMLPGLFAIVGLQMGSGSN